MVMVYVPAERGPHKKKKNERPREDTDFRAGAKLPYTYLVELLVVSF